MGWQGYGSSPCLYIQLHTADDLLHAWLSALESTAETNGFCNSGNASISVAAPAVAAAVTAAAAAAAAI
jgi:hypothetical protein